MITFTENGLNDYVDFLRNKKDMRNSTIGKQIAFLKCSYAGVSRKGTIRTWLMTASNPS